jgi:hypothetical protein
VRSTSPSPTHEVGFNQAARHVGSELVLSAAHGNVKKPTLPSIYCAILVASLDGMTSTTLRTRSMAHSWPFAERMVEPRRSPRRTLSWCRRPSPAIQGLSRSETARGKCTCLRVAPSGPGRQGEMRWFRICDTGAGHTVSYQAHKNRVNPISYDLYGAPTLSKVD